MKADNFFQNVVEPSSERLGFYGVAHDVNFDGHDFIVTHKVSKIILTEFDGHLSRYLAAITGKGLPGACVETIISDAGSDRTWSPKPAHMTSGIIDAMAIAVRLALGSEARVKARTGPWLSNVGGLDNERPLTVDAAYALDQAEVVCAQIGGTEFLDMSGDLSRILVRPQNAKLDMLMMDLDRGTVAVPTTSELAGTAYQGPLYGFEKQARQTPSVGSYLARARHYVSQAKEDAIYAFRQAAEARIADFDNALGGRELAEYRLDSARSLVSRLQAGLGDTLLGLSEPAQLTALDWAAEVRQLPEPKSTALRGSGALARPQLVR